MNTLVFANPSWGYALVVFLAFCGAGVALFSVRDWTRHRSTASRINAAALGILALVSFWIGFHTGYEWFYALRVMPHQGVVVSRLWPRGDTFIPVNRIAEIRVFHPFDTPRHGPSPYVQIVLTTGQRIESTSPLPPLDTLEREIISLPADQTTTGHEWTEYKPSQ